MKGSNAPPSHAQAPAPKPASPCCGAPTTPGALWLDLTLAAGGGAATTAATGGEGGDGMVQRKCCDACPDDELVQRKADGGGDGRPAPQGPKLSRPGDPHERAADAFAEAVAGGASTPAPPRPSAPHPRLPTTPAPFGLGLGRPLDGPRRAPFEARLGVDLGGVRVHDDTRARELAGQFRAKAFTTGSHIAFGPDQFAPERPEGMRLLAHELAHVAQQARLSLPAGELVHRNPNGPDAPAAPGGGSGGEAPAGPPAPGTPGGPAADSTPVRPASDWFTFRGFNVANDREFMRGELRRIVARSGLDGAATWYGLLVANEGRGGSGMGLPFSAHARGYGGLRPRTAIDAQQDMANEQRRAAVAPAAIPMIGEVWGEVRTEAQDFLRTFEERARETTRGILRESEVRVEAERIRYGIETTRTERTRYRTDEFGVTMPETEVTETHRMADNLSTRGLQGAVQDLRAKQAQVSELSLRRERLVRTTTHPRGGVVTRHVPPENQAAYDELTTQMEQRRSEHDILRATYEERYPILAAYAQDLSALAQLATGPSSASAAVLAAQIQEKLANIERVRGGLIPGGRVKVWKLPEIVSLTKAATGAMPGTPAGAMRLRLVDDEVRRIESEEFWTNLAIAALAIGLAALAAIPTGGSSLAAGVAAVASIGSMGLSLAQVGEHLQQYQMEQAMAGSDFDRARAISAEDPSLFWLAVDIVGAALDVGPALRGTRTLMTASRSTFRSIAPAVRRALAARGAEAATELAQLRRTVEASAGGAGLANRVATTVERLQGAGASVERTLARAAGHEARAVGESATALAQQAERGLARVPTRLGGHSVTVTPSGWLVRCSVCGTLREEFASELARNHELATQLFEIEARAATAARTSNRTLAEQAANEARQLADRLEAFRRTREVRLYRGLRPGAMDDVYLMDSRLVVDMPYVGRGAANANAAGWMRDAGHYWEEIARRHPEAFSPDNLRRIRGEPPLTGPVPPINDAQFRRVFPQYDVRGLRGQPLIHHHVGGGGQAAAIPGPLHPGSGGIYNAERGAGIWGGEDPTAEMLQRLLEGSTP